MLQRPRPVLTEQCALMGELQVMTTGEPHAVTRAKEEAWRLVTTEQMPKLGFRGLRSDALVYRPILALLRESRGELLNELVGAHLRC